MRSDSRPLVSNSWLLLGLSAIASIARLLVLLNSYDVPGDGPMRAIEGYQWSRRPWLPTSGVWPPGFLFLIGPANWLFPHPILTSRLVDVFLGTLTVPALFLLARRSFGPGPAIVASAALAVWPLHVELSASSLSETSFLAELVGGLLLLEVGLDEGRSRWLLAAGVALLSLAATTRYEGWWILPLVPARVFLESRRLGLSLVVATTAAAFPVAWLLGNHLHAGDALAGFHAAARGARMVGADTVGLGGALRELIFASADQVGWPLVLLAPASALSVAARLRARCRRRLDLRSPRTLYLAVLATIWLGLVYVASVRGSSLYGRYLLAGWALALPAVCAPLLPGSPWNRRTAAILLSVLLVSFASAETHRPHRWVTTRRPTALTDVAAWISARAGFDGLIFMTDMNWTASYLGVLRPQLADRIVIVSDWMTDDTLGRLVRHRRPDLFVTSDDDVQQRRRVEQALGEAIPPSAERYHSAGTRVFEIDPRRPAESG